MPRVIFPNCEGLERSDDSLNELSSSSDLVLSPVIKDPFDEQLEFSRHERSWHKDEDHICSRYNRLIASRGVINVSLPDRDEEDFICTRNYLPSRTIDACAAAPECDDVCSSSSSLSSKSDAIDSSARKPEPKSDRQCKIM